MARIKRGRLVKKSLINTRKFLNRKGHHTIALVHGGVEVEYTDVSECLDAWLTIGDCSHRVDLSLDHYTAKEFNNSLRKLDLLIEAISDTRNAFAKGYSLLEKAKRAREAREKMAKQKKIQQNKKKARASQKAAG